MKRGVWFLALWVGAIVAWADTPVEMLQGALDAYFGGRYEESIHYFQQILSTDPHNKQARAGLKNARRKQAEQIRQERDAERKSLFAGQAFLSQGKRVEAFDRAKEILTRAPQLPEAKKLVEKIRFDAQKTLRKSKPGSSVFLEAQGDLAYMDGDWFKAVDCWEKVLVYNQERADLLRRLSLVKKRVAEDQRAERLHVLLGLARVNLDQGLYDETLKTLNDLLQTDPTHAEARGLLVEARRAQTQAKKAAQDSRVQDLTQRAIDAYSSGKKKEALGLFQSVLAIDADNRLAEEYRKRLLGIEEILLDVPAPKARSSDPDLVRAQASFTAGNYLESIEILERVLDKEPLNVKAQQQLDEVKTRQKEAAEKNYRDALTSYSRGNRTEAVRLLEESRRVDPHFLKAKQALVKIMQEGNP